jgi:two-component system response regulator HydG
MATEFLAQPTRKPPRILIVDDDPGQRSLLDSFLSSQGFQTVTAVSGEQALEILTREAFSMMISDVRMPGISGLETLRRARQQQAVLPVLLVTAYADIREAVGAMRDGAVNYLAKPIDLDELLVSVQQAIGLAKSPPLHLAEDRHLPESVIAESPLMRAVFRDAALVAPSESRVLITGESGVGKEILAEVIHAWSTRAAGPLVKVNCAAIPENLLESELFGHERGAYTGADRRREGRFEQANGGTLFLDEIGDITASTQVKLLRVLQERQFERVGGNQTIKVDVRIIAATNRDLPRMVKEGTFREDLYYRLNVVTIEMPSLRERPSDIALLATHFLRKYAGENDKAVVGFAEDALAALTRYHWPGNVRELENAIERAVIVARTDVIRAADLAPQIVSAERPSTGGPPVPGSTIAELERYAILKTLEHTGGSTSRAAEILGISTRKIQYRLREYQDGARPPAGDDE